MADQDENVARLKAEIAALELKREEALEQASNHGYCWHWGREDDAKLEDLRDELAEILKPTGEENIDTPFAGGLPTQI
jgi:hypothetical protein